MHNRKMILHNNIKNLNDSSNITIYNNNITSIKFLELYNNYSKPLNIIFLYLNSDIIGIFYLIDLEYKIFEDNILFFI